ncbi:16822_t:CDS:2 [Funneliformis geosporum]|uniref:6377_t:CDS:1 n=1 Tax=Funneliformis geosporum TaxID=1117311 RepID=A0A9W4WYL8_9GLOM|nr:16822_t:CDS:2 [Funneliformis geosporum]CAI2182014.1 6377_t:CDS:2 [Funneliformis geosporum]
MKPTVTKLEYEKIKKDALVIDVRSKLEHQTLLALPNSVNIYYEDLMNNPTKYISNQSQLIITYCNLGNRSGQAAEFLHQRGYQVFVLEGGIENYFKEKVKMPIAQWIRVFDFGSKDPVSIHCYEELEQLKATQTKTKPKTNQRNKLILDFLFYTGLRVNELINIRHSDYQKGLLRILGKGNKVRYVLLPEFLTKYFDPYSKNYLFLTRNGKKLTKGQNRRNIKRKCRQAGIKKNISPHSFRRSLATNLYNSGGKLETIQKQLGHTSLDTTLGYIYNDYQTLYADYSKLWLVKNPKREYFTKDKMIKVEGNSVPTEGNLRLNKLLQITQMLYAAKEGKYLFPEKFWAFEHGGIIYDIYHQFHFLVTPHRYISFKDLTTNLKTFLTKIFDYFKTYSNQQLEDFVHEDPA